jgi:hypothetical protein
MCPRSHSSSVAATATCRRPGHFRLLDSYQPAAGPLVLRPRHRARCIQHHFWRPPNPPAMVIKVNPRTPSGMALVHRHCAPRSGPGSTTLAPSAIVSRRHSSVRPRRCSCATAVAPLVLLPGGRASPQGGREEHRFAGSQVASSSPSPVGRAAADAAASISSRVATTAATTRTVRSDGCAPSRCSSSTGHCRSPPSTVRAIPRRSLPRPWSNTIAVHTTLLPSARWPSIESTEDSSAQGEVNPAEKLGGFLNAERPTERAAGRIPLIALAKLEQPHRRNTIHSDAPIQQEM